MSILGTPRDGRSPRALHRDVEKLWIVVGSLVELKFALGTGFAGR
jgi:hypothetical protein